MIEVIETERATSGLRTASEDTGDFAGEFEGRTAPRKPNNLSVVRRTRQRRLPRWRRSGVEGKGGRK
ncbi:hypothetical protein BHE74_00048844 [Ensete ventricosum]|nr:hypothetical protein BHE74_00048844 [Ensete ventricosum]